MVGFTYITCLTVNKMNWLVCYRISQLRYCNTRCSTKDNFWAFGWNEFQEQEWVKIKALWTETVDTVIDIESECAISYQPPSLQETIKTIAEDCAAIKFLAGQSISGKKKGWANNCRNWNYALTFEGVDFSDKRLKLYTHLINLRLEEELE